MTKQEKHQQTLNRIIDEAIGRIESKAKAIMAEEAKEVIRNLDFSPLAKDLENSILIRESMAFKIKSQKGKIAFLEEENQALRNMIQEVSETITKTRTDLLI